LLLESYLVGRRVSTSLRLRAAAAATIVDFYNKMKEGLGPRFIPGVMALLWKAYNEPGWTVRVRVETLRPVP